MASKLNAEWHMGHRMPPKGTLEQRLEWHVEHRKHCGCREMPAAIKDELARRNRIAAQSPTPGDGLPGTSGGP